MCAASLDSSSALWEVTWKLSLSCATLRSFCFILRWRHAGQRKPFEMHGVMGSLASRHGTGTRGRGSSHSFGEELAAYWC